MTINHDWPWPIINILVKLIPSLKPKKGSLWSGTERSPWPLGKCMNDQREGKKEIQFQSQWPGFQKLISLSISFGCHLILVSDQRMRFIVLSLFHLLNLKCWWCREAAPGMQTSPHPARGASYLPHYEVRSLHEAFPFTLLSPPNDSQGFCCAMASLWHQTECVPAPPGYSWEEQIVPG